VLCIRAWWLLLAGNLAYSGANTGFSGARIYQPQRFWLFGKFSDCERSEAKSGLPSTRAGR